MLDRLRFYDFMNEAILKYDKFYIHNIFYTTLFSNK